MGGRQLAAGAAAAVAIAMLAVAIGRTSGDEPGETRLRLPRAGEAHPERLPDGAPVFVVRLIAGDVVVVEARSPHLDAPVGWCARARTFEDPRYGSLFDLRGRRHRGPAPRGLATFEVLRLDERHVWVGQRVPGVPRGERPSPPTGRLCADEPHLLIVHDEVVVEAGG